MIYRIFLLCFTLLLFSCEEETQPQQSFGEVPSGRLLWHPGQFPTGSKIQLSLSEEFETEIIGAESDLTDTVLDISMQWDDSVSKIDFFTTSPNIVSNLDYANLESYWDASHQTKIGIYLHYDWFTEIPSQAVAITQFYAVVDTFQGKPYYRLLHADIIFNARNHSFSMDPSDTHHYHFPTVLMHEMGHLLGLDHNFDYSSGSVMIPSFSSMYYQNNLSVADQNKIERKYRFFNSSGTNAIRFSRNNNFSLRGKKIKRFISYLYADGTCDHKEHPHHQHNKDKFKDVLKKLSKNKLKDNF